VLLDQRFFQLDDDAPAALTGSHALTVALPHPHPSFGK
jgi:hypothetical protein